MVEESGGYRQEGKRKSSRRGRRQEQALPTASRWSGRRREASGPGAAGPAAGRATEAGREGAASTSSSVARRRGAPRASGGALPWPRALACARRARAGCGARARAACPLVAGSRRASVALPPNWGVNQIAPSRLSCSSLMRTLCVANSSGLTLASWPAPYPAPIESPTRLRESFSERNVS